ncbi:MAG TPA: SRPBCC family protein [Ktedonobacterales bacterium]|nr:SRPBCC family protein [Ktedonobacterales bacterium]
MPDIPAEAVIQCPAERIFDLILDFGGQSRWLSTSSAFHGTTEVSPDPVMLGTTYREPGPFGVRHGRVTEFERPTAITFHQPMTMRLHAGTVDVLMRYTLTPVEGDTRVRRVVTLGIPWSLKLVQPVLIRAFRTESSRTLRALKAYAETLASS